MPAPRSRSQVDDAHAFGALVRRRRKERGLNQKELAHLVGFHPGHVSKLETGQTGPPADEAIASFADALDGDIVEFMDAAGRSLDRNVFERRVLDALERLVEEQRDGFKRLDAAISRLARD